MTSSHAEPVAGPSGSGTVVLELGPGAGALVLHTPADMNGAEIDISTASGARTHSMVRPRHVAAGTLYAAVYPGLAPGEYTIWRADGTPALAVRIADGAATTASWPVAALAPTPGC
jgi:hypothetical protein